MDSIPTIEGGKKNKRKKKLIIVIIGLTLKTAEISRAWWRMPLIPALGRQRPGLQSEFQDSQGYTEKP